MPTPVTSSFIKDLQQALIDKVLSDLGVDSTAYPIERYQQIVFAGRSGGRPSLPRVEDQLPSFWIEYLGGGSEKTEIGHGRRVPSWAVEVFNCYVVINLTPEIMGCERDDQTFYGAAEAAVDILMRCLVDLLVEYDPSITDAILGYKTNGQRIRWWAFVPRPYGDLSVDYTIGLRYEALVEI